MNWTSEHAPAAGKAARRAGANLAVDPLGTENGGALAEV
jgi:hypothetical protein